MSKIKIKETRLFREVTKVIGPKNAERELFIASQSKQGRFLSEGYLIRAFSWKDTPQGHDFWSSIYKGVKPYGVHYG